MKLFHCIGTTCFRLLEDSSGFFFLVDSRADIFFHFSLVYIFVMHVIGSSLLCCGDYCVDNECHQCCMLSTVQPTKISNRRWSISTYLRAWEPVWGKYEFMRALRTVPKGVITDIF